MKIRRFVIIIACVLALAIAGCGSINYYKITDPGSGNTYFSQRIEKKSGSVSCTDAKSGSMDTLQNSCTVPEILLNSHCTITLLG